jgi:hypothetical protein
VEKGEIPILEMEEQTYSPVAEDKTQSQTLMKLKEI